MILSCILLQLSTNVSIFRLTSNVYIFSAFSAYLNNYKLQNLSPAAIIEKAERKSDDMQLKGYYRKVVPFTPWKRSSNSQNPKNNQNCGNIFSQNTTLFYFISIRKIKEMKSYIVMVFNISNNSGKNERYPLKQYTGVLKVPFHATVLSLDRLNNSVDISSVNKICNKSLYWLQIH